MDYQEILDFWFGALDSIDDPASDKSANWFSKSRTFDLEVKARFSSTIIKVAQGEFDVWHKTSAGTLATIIVLDQFPRHVFRETEKAYEFDDKALKVTLAGLLKRFDKELFLIERIFFCMPLMHSENPKIQVTSLQKYAEILNDSTEKFRAIAENSFNYAKRHADIIDRFGRFPHRNAVLKRASTEMELEFLKMEDGSF